MRNQPNRRPVAIRLTFGPFAAFAVAAGLLFMPFGPVAGAADGEWPTFRYDSGRTGSTPHELAEELHLQWVRELPEPQRAWPQQMDDFEKLWFDKSYEPVAANGMLYVPSMVTDSVTAYCAESGEEVWRYHTDGPVRMAPAVADGRLYAVSDDGHLHCLDAETGEQHWKFKAAANDRLVLGNERIISMGASRGGPLVHDGSVYFAAGLWPHEGIFIYSLDAETGDVNWVDSGSGSGMYIDSKRYYSFGGVTPQGHLTVAGNRLIVPGGRTPPAGFDLDTGDLIFFRTLLGKGTGGHRVFTDGEWYFNWRDAGVVHMYHAQAGAQLGQFDVHLITSDAFVGVNPENEEIVAYDREVQAPEGADEPEVIYDRRGRTLPGMDEDRESEFMLQVSRTAQLEGYEVEQAWTKSVEGIERLHMAAGDTLYGSGPDGRIFAIRSPQITEAQLARGTRDREQVIGDAVNRPPELLWSDSVEGEVFSMLAAHGRLYVVTEEGRIYCFGPDEQDPVIHEHAPADLESEEDVWAARAYEALADTDLRGGYGLMFGVGSGRLLEELLAQSGIHITAYDPDPEKVEEMRERFMEAGLYGSRVSVHQGDPLSLRLPPYIASLIVSEDPESAGIDMGAPFVQAVFHPLRPYGGNVYLPLEQDAQAAFANAVENAGLENYELNQNDNFALLTRPGALPGSDVWTHQYSDAANTAYASDDRVKAPLGIAWFGGAPNHKTLPRHMHGPIPQAVDGRLIILGPHHISARCVYTGIQLWALELPEVGDLFTDWDYEAREAPVYFPNHPGANFVGSPYASAADSIYLIYDDECLRIDAATGEIADTFQMPDIDDLRQRAPDPLTEELMESYGAQVQEGEELRWGNIRYSGDYLIAAAYPHMFDDQQPAREDNWNKTSSEFVVGMDRFTGEVLWVHQARYGFRHNAIAAGPDKVFVIDNLSEEIRNILDRRGIEPDVDPEIRALDIATGNLVWYHGDEVFGTSLSYSADQDVLVQSGHPGRRRALPDEPRDRLHAFRGETGETLWAESYQQRRSPIGMHADWGEIIGSTGENAVDMLTGAVRYREHPVTGVTEEWQWIGGLRCGTQNYSKHLATFRTGAAAYADLTGGATTGNIPGYRPGCTNNMIVAEGMLNSPEYSRSCSCSYQLQTSLGLVHMPDAEMWTYSPLPDPAPGQIRRAGVNFGAPGSRLQHEREMLWVDYPLVGGPAPYVPVQVETEDGEERWFRHHASMIEEENDGIGWVAASGLRGARSITLSDLYNESNPGEEPTYTVRLHFAEPDHDVVAGQRVFNVKLQGETVLSDYDIVAETGGPRRVAVADVNDVRLAPGGELTVELEQAGGAEREPIISGIELFVNE